MSTFIMSSNGVTAFGWKFCRSSLKPYMILAEKRHDCRNVFYDLLLNLPREFTLPLNVVRVAKICKPRIDLRITITLVVLPFRRDLARGKDIAQIADHVVLPREEDDVEFSGVEDAAVCIRREEEWRSVAVDFEIDADLFPPILNELDLRIGIRRPRR